MGELSTLIGDELAGDSPSDEPAVYLCVDGEFRSKGVLDTSQVTEMVVWQLAYTLMVKGEHALLPPSLGLPEPWSYFRGTEQLRTPYPVLSLLSGVQYDRLADVVLLFGRDPDAEKENLINWLSILVGGEETPAVEVPDLVTPATVMISIDALPSSQKLIAAVLPTIWSAYSWLHLPDEELGARLDAMMEEVSSKGCSPSYLLRPFASDPQAADADLVKHVEVCRLCKGVVEHLQALPSSSPPWVPDRHPAEGFFKSLEGLLLQIRDCTPS